MPLSIESTSSSNSEYVIRNFLTAHHSGVLATSDSSGNPHGAVVYYVLEDDLTMLFATKSETEKNKNIEENNNVNFVVYEENEQSQLQISGHATKVDDENVQQKIFKAMYRNSSELSHEELPPAEKLLASDFVVYRLVPSAMKMAVYARPDAEEVDDLFETILFSNSDTVD